MTDERRETSTSFKEFLERENAVSLKEHTEAVCKLRNERADERFKRVWDTFTALEKQIRLSLAASEKAVEVAAAAQRQINETQNEFRGALQDYVKELATKADVVGLDKRIQTIERGGSAEFGYRAGGTETRLEADRSRERQSKTLMIVIGLAGLMISASLGLIGALMFLAKLLPALQPAVHP
jgi:hypothetical protein